MDLFLRGLCLPRGATAGQNAAGAGMTAVPAMEHLEGRVGDPLIASVKPR